MVNLDKPFTFENSSNPWLMDKKNDSAVLTIKDKEGVAHKLTAKYLWSMNVAEREAAFHFVFNHYRKNGFPKIVLSKSELDHEFKKLCEYNVDSVLNKDGYVSNSGNLCIDLCKYFCQEHFYRAKGNAKTLSVRDVFESDELLMRVLKNRMGWNSSKEDGTERPYLFPISDKQILNGIRNSGIGYAVSNFRPTIGKWMYAKAAELAGIEKKERKVKVFDYSAGWAARALAALSLGFDYDATDPLTNECVRKCVDAFKTEKQECRIFNKCSEDEEFFRKEEFAKRYDVVGSCPPYFDLEIYSDDEKQSTSSCNNYNMWLDAYWKGTVENCSFMMKDNGVFVLVMKEIVENHEILKDMCGIALKCGLEPIEKHYYKTTTNHLSGKTKSRRSSKTNEAVVFFKKKN